MANVTLFVFIAIVIPTIIISFADDGMLMISRDLNSHVRKAWGLEQPAPARPYTSQQRVHLHYHRQQIFEKIGGGRRSVTEIKLEQDRAG